jgi:hypothetical protein
MASVRVMAGVNGLTAGTEGQVIQREEHYAFHAIELYAASVRRGKRLSKANKKPRGTLRVDRQEPTPGA